MRSGASMRAAVTCSPKSPRASPCTPSTIPLNAREVEVLQLIANGNSNKQIARDLNVSEDAIKSNIKSIFTKLYVNDRTHAVTVAAKRGIIDL